MRLRNLLLVPLWIGCIACSQVNSVKLPPSPTSVQSVIPSATPGLSAQSSPTPTLAPPRLLTVCLINEPRSLFLYDAVSSSEKSVLEAIYDGPIDVNNFTPTPVILEKIPSLADGDALLQEISISPGDLIMDARGSLTNLQEGVLYRPSGCTSQACALVYSGTDSVQMDQLVVRFKLLLGLQWSDGMPLTAADSVYSYEVARSMNSAALPEQVNRTSSYKALNDMTVEWTGVPGFMDGQYQTKFFSPLPQHAWSSIPPDRLATDEASSKKPLGWGPYVIDEWVPKDHISLHANPLYFRSSEGLPHFNNLEYRFVADSSEALSAVLAGECDLVDPAAGLETQMQSLLKFREQGKISLFLQPASAWELLEFNVAPLSSDRPAFFASKEVRQAVALCIDRQAMVDSLSGEQLQVADSYVPTSHPLYNPDAKHYTYNPQAASDLLATAGWLDADHDPSTPRIAHEVNGVADGTSFTLQYLTADDAEHQAAAQLVKADLQKCGIQVNIDQEPVQQYLVGGPDGPVFGRAFDLAQFAWTTSLEPPCTLYLSTEIPGPYPDYPLGWGGVNAGGYGNPAYDQACLDATYSLPDLPQNAQEHAEAQAIFAEDLPVLPLYWHVRVAVGRPDICGISQQEASENIFSGLESFNYGESCP
jgi:peptide/nickel transport system substrate-binding protein